MSGAFKNERIASVLQTFGGTVLRRSSVCMEFESFLQRIEAKGKCCLEIGTYYGISTMILAQYFERVVTISIEDVGTDLRIKHQVWQSVGAKNIESIDLRDNAQKGDVLAGLKFDFAYLDGDHLNDTRTDFKLTRRCGRVLFHEYWPLQPMVWELVNSLPQDEVTRAQFDCFAFWKWNKPA